MEKRWEAKLCHRLRKTQRPGAPLGGRQQGDAEVALAQQAQRLGAVEIAVTSQTRFFAAEIALNYRRSTRAKSTSP